MSDGLSLEQVRNVSKSPQVFRSLLSILANLNNALVWMVSPRTLICKSSKPLTNPLVHRLQIVSPSHSSSISFSVFLQGLWNCSFFSFLLILLCSLPPWQRPLFPCFSLFVFLLLTLIRPGCLAEIWWSVYMSKPERTLCVLFSRKDSGFCIYQLFE